MTVNVRVLQQAVSSTGGGTQDFTISGFGTPKGFLAFLTNATANNTITDNAIVGFGACDGTRQWTTTSGSQNGLATSQSARRGATNEAIMLYNSTMTAVAFEASFNSWITDGVRLNIDASNAAYLLTLVFFGGTDITCYAATDTLTGTPQNFTAAGFQPDLIFFGSNTASFADTNSDSFSHSMGAASRTSPIRQGSLTTFDADNASTKGSSAWVGDASVIASISQDSLSRSINVSAFLSTGFTMTRTGASFNLGFGYLVLSFGGAASYDVRHFTSPTSTGSFSRTTFGFAPQFVGLFDSFTDTLGTIEVVTSQGAGSTSVAMMDATNQYALSVSTEDGVSTSNTQSLVNNKAVHVMDGAGTVQFEGTLTSFDATGYTLNLTTANGTARRWFEVGIEEISAGGTTYTGSITDVSDTSDTFASVQAMATAIIDAANAAESWATGLIAQAQLSESSDASDTFASLVSYLLSLSESADTSDTFDALLQIANALSESSTASETLSALLTVQTSLSDSASASDAWVSSLVSAIIGSITESAEASDSLTVIQRMATAIAEAADAGESWAADLIAQAQISESADATDSFSSLITAISALSEGGLVADVFSGDIATEFDLAFEEAVTGGGSGTSVTSATITGVTNHLYLAAVASRPNVEVTSVTGLGLTWTLVDAQPSGGGNTRMTVFSALGTPSGNGTVTANFASSTNAAAIGVSRYSGAAVSDAIGAVVSANTNGIDGADTGGTDTNSYSFNLTTTADNSFIYAAASTRNRSHVAVSPYTERYEIETGGGANITTVASMDRLVASPGSTAVEGNLSGTADWAVVAVEVLVETGVGNTYTGSVSEGLDASDAFASIRRMAESITDISDVSEIYEVLVRSLVSITNGAVSANTITALLRAQAVISEGATVSESVVSLLRALAALSEGATVSETLSALLTVQSAISDSATGGDQWLAEIVTAIIGAISEGADASDVFAAVLAAVAALSESADASDTFSALFSTSGTISESADASDVFAASLLGAIVGIINESANASDAFNILLTAVGVMAEGGTASETLTAFLRATGAVSEETLASESFSLLLMAVGLLNESATASDAFTSVITVLSAISDGARSGDVWIVDVAGSLLVEIIDGARTSDTYSTFLQAVEIISESADVAEAFLVSTRMTLAVSDIAETSDAWLLTLAGGITGAINEGSNAADAFLTQLRAISAIAEEARASELLTSRMTMPVALSESLLSSEVFSPVVRIDRSIIDLVEVSDTSGILVRHRPALTDVAVADDLWATRYTARIGWIESVLTSELFSVPLPFDVGFVSATIRISAAIAASMNVHTAVDATLDINRHYNE